MEVSPIKPTLTQAVPQAGSIFKILPARGTRQRKFEFGYPLSLELSYCALELLKKIRPPGKTYLKPLKQTKVKDVYRASVVSQRTNLSLSLSPY